MRVNCARNERRSALAVGIEFQSPAGMLFRRTNVKSLFADVERSVEPLLFCKPENDGIVPAQLEEVTVKVLPMEKKSEGFQFAT